MTFQLPKIYPITDTRVSGISIPEQVERLIAGGATLVQVREKSMPSRQFYEAAAAAVAIGRSRGVLVLINDRVDIALTAGADGVHLGQDDLPPTEARKILGPNAIIGLSTHTVEQAAEGLKMPVDYLAIGPIFDTSTKLNPDAVVGTAGLKNVRRVIGGFPLVAIGGISRSNVNIRL